MTISYTIMPTSIDQRSVAHNAERNRYDGQQPHDGEFGKVEGRM